MKIFILIIALLSIAPAINAQYQAAPQLTITNLAPQNFQLTWLSKNQRPYFLEGSANLTTWADVSDIVLGNGSVKGIALTNTAPKFFYRLREGAIRPGFNGISMSREDDHTYPQYAVPGVQGNALKVNLGFKINFFGKVYEECYVNNNGNISFDFPFSSFTPRPLRILETKIIAPFWADVDTRNEISGVSKFTSGGELVDNRAAFGVTYENVGYFYEGFEKLNSFQLVIIERHDTGENNFDIEFNYNKVLWESTTSSDGESARVGFTNGGTFSLELNGSGVPSYFLDKNLGLNTPNYSNGLIYNSYGDDNNVPGRYILKIRNGIIEGSFAINAGPDQTLGANQSATFQLNGSVNPSGISGLTYKWTQIDSNLPVTFSNSSILNPQVTIKEVGDYEFELTATKVGTTTINSSDTVTVSHPATFDVDAGEGLYLTAPDSLTQTLHGTASFSGGANVSVQWTQTEGDNAIIVNPTSLDPTVTLPGAGFYEFKMTATTNHAPPFVKSSTAYIIYNQE